MNGSRGTRGTKEEQREDGNTERSSSRASPKKARNWVFTWNNYPEFWFQMLIDSIGNKDIRYIMQPEIGESGTPHIQGYIEFPNPRSLGGLKKLSSKIHWEISRNCEASINYCKKVGSKAGICRSNVTSWKPVEPFLVELRPWQQRIVEIVKNPADKFDRSIHWFWETKGGSGKTSLAKHLCTIYPGLIQYVSGGAKDMKFAIAKHVNAGHELRACIMNLTRTVEDHVSYQGIEELKDGIFFSSKYESGMCMYPTPHVIIFANFLPNEESMSKDRWRITEL
jgi:hypothetical protein